MVTVTRNKKIAFNFVNLLKYEEFCPPLKCSTPLLKLKYIVLFQSLPLHPSSA